MAQPKSGKRDQRYSVKNLYPGGVDPRDAVNPFLEARLQHPCCRRHRPDPPPARPASLTVAATKYHSRPGTLDRPGAWHRRRHGSGQIVASLLVQCDIQALSLLVLRHPQTDQGTDELQDEVGHHRGEGDRRSYADQLHIYLTAHAADRS